MINTAAMNIALLILGSYLVVDSLYLANEASGERRTCLIARYVGAFMCGLYDLSIPITDFLVHTDLIDLSASQTLTYKDLETLLLFSLTIALFMWGDTFYRVLWWMQCKHVEWYRAFTARFEVPQRRRGG